MAAGCRIGSRSDLARRAVTPYPPTSRRAVARAVAVGGHPPDRHPRPATLRIPRRRDQSSPRARRQLPRLPAAGRSPPRRRRDRRQRSRGAARALEERPARAEALAEIDRAKTTFFSNISHEFRTPLALMLGPLEETLRHAHGVLPRQAALQLG